MVTISNDLPTSDSAAPVPRSKSGFSLSSLALLITVQACLLACADIQLWRKQYAELAAIGTWPLVALFAGAGIFGGIVGLVYVIGRSRRWRIWLFAPLMGALASEAAMLILLAPGAMWRTIFSVSILLFAAILFRLGAD